MKMLLGVTAVAAVFASGLLLVAFLLLGASFFRTQVLQNARYSLQSEENRLREVPLPTLGQGIVRYRTGKVVELQEQKVEQ